MLTREDAIRLLTEYGKGAAWTRHCFAVANAAHAVGSELDGSCAIDLDALWATALLHDIGRCFSHDPIAHGVEGHNLLIGLGYEDAAFVCASHVLFGFDASVAVSFGLPARDFVPRTLEERIVPLVDYLIEHDHATTLDARFSSLRQRNAGNSPFLGRLDRAQECATGFMEQLSVEVGRPIEEVVASCHLCS